MRNTCPIFRYELITDDAEYEGWKAQRSAGDDGSYDFGDDARGHYYEWRLLSSLQDGCFSNQSASSSRDFKISIQTIPVIISFCGGVSASMTHQWTTLSGSGAEDVRVMTRKSVDDPGRPPGIVLNAATSFWLHVPPKRVFDFLRDRTSRSETHTHNEEFPYVRYRAAKFSLDASTMTTLRDLVPTKLVAGVWNCLARYKTAIPDFHQRETCELLIVDRAVDQIAPIIHEWTYDAMCHDLLNMEGNKYVHEVCSKSGKKEGLLEDHDPIWLELRHAHIADASERLHEKMTNFISRNKAAQIHHNSRKCSRWREKREEQA